MSIQGHALGRQDFAIAFFIFLISICLLSQICNATICDPIWIEVQSHNAPTPSAAVYNPNTHCVISYGAAVGASSDNSMTHSWNGSHWTSMQSTGPSGRSSRSIGWDTANNRTMLFGGWDGVSIYDDTWSLDEGGWNQVLLPNHPSSRDNSAVSTDTNRLRMVLFGGNSTTSSLGDTWEWTGTEWIQHYPSVAPSLRNGMAMAYIPTISVTMLYGGFNYSDGFLGDTWLWNGATWEESSVAGPLARQFSTAVYDERRARVLMFGGRTTDDNPTNELWEFDGNSWSRLEINNPPNPRFAHAMAYDSLRDSVVIFGGRNGNQLYDDTWVLTPLPFIKEILHSSNECPKSMIRVSATTLGIQTLEYTWFKNGIRQSSSFGESLVVFAQPGDSYYCEARNQCGTTTSYQVHISQCSADFNCNNSVTVIDIFLFLETWFTGASDANYNLDCCINVQDIFDYLSSWFSGC